VNSKKKDLTLGLFQSVHVEDRRERCTIWQRCKRLGSLPMPFGLNGAQCAASPRSAKKRKVKGFPPIRLKSTKNIERCAFTSARCEKAAGMCQPLGVTMEIRSLLHLCCGEAVCRSVPPPDGGVDYRTPQPPRRYEGPCRPSISLSHELRSALRSCDKELRKNRLRIAQF